MASVDNDKLFEILKDVEFLNFESGQYFRMVAVNTESTGTVVTIEKID